MNTNKNSIITEDGQRLTIDEGLIRGTEDTGQGLAYETGNVTDEKSDVEKNTCSNPVQSGTDDPLDKKK